MGYLARGQSHEGEATFKRLKKKGARVGRSMGIVKPASEKFFVFLIAFARPLLTLGHAPIQ